MRAELDRIDARNQQIRKQLGIEEVMSGPVSPGDETIRGAPSGDSGAPGTAIERVGRPIAPE